MNNLNELNDILFETMRGVKDGTVDLKKAQQIGQLGTTIINGAKAQISAFKVSGRKNESPAILGLPEKKKETGSSPGERMAADLGYDSISEMRAELGHEKFTEHLKSYK